MPISWDMILDLSVVAHLDDATVQLCTTLV